MEKIILIISESLELGEVLTTAVSSILSGNITVQSVYRDYNAEQFLASDNLLAVVFTGKTKTKDEYDQSILTKYDRGDILNKLKNKQIPLIKATNWLGKVSASKVQKEIKKLNLN